MSFLNLLLNRTPAGRLKKANSDDDTDAQTDDQQQSTPPKPFMQTVDTSGADWQNAPPPSPVKSAFTMSPRLKDLQDKQDYLNTHQNSRIDENGNIEDLNKTSRLGGFGQGFTSNIMSGGLAGGLLGGIQGATHPDEFNKQKNAESRANINNQVGIELKRRAQGILEANEQSEIASRNANTAFTEGAKTQNAQAAIDAHKATMDAAAERLRESQLDKLTGPGVENRDGTRTYLFRKSDGSFYEKTIGKGGKEVPQSMGLGESRPGPNGGTYIGMGTGRAPHFEPGTKPEVAAKNEAQRSAYDKQYNDTIAELEDQKDAKGNVTKQGAKSGLDITNKSIADINSQITANESKKPGEDDDPKEFAKAQNSERTRLKGLMATAQANKKSQETRIQSLTKQAQDLAAKRDAIPRAQAQPTQQPGRVYSVKKLMDANKGMTQQQAISKIREWYGNDAKISY
jgi:hypothetical protein